MIIKYVNANQQKITSWNIQLHRHAVTVTQSLNKEKYFYSKS